MKRPLSVHGASRKARRRSSFAPELRRIRLGDELLHPGRLVVHPPGGDVALALKVARAHERQHAEGHVARDGCCPPSGRTDAGQSRAPCRRISFVGLWQCASTTAPDRPLLLRYGRCFEERKPSGRRRLHRAASSPCLPLCGIICPFRSSPTSRWTAFLAHRYPRANPQRIDLLPIFWLIRGLFSHALLPRDSLSHWLSSRALFYPERTEEGQVRDEGHAHRACASRRAVS